MTAPRVPSMVTGFMSERLCVVQTPLECNSAMGRLPVPRIFTQNCAQEGEATNFTVAAWRIPWPQHHATGICTMGRGEPASGEPRLTCGNRRGMERSG